MNIVSIERILIIDILVLICTMIGMNYADPVVMECMSKVDRFFVVQNPLAIMNPYIPPVIEYKSIEERIRFIITRIKLADIPDKFTETMYIRHLFNAISEATPMVARNAEIFCSAYEMDSENCITALKSVGIERNATSQIIVKHVYYNLKQEGAGYIYDLVQHVHDSLQIMPQDLFGVEDTHHFCRMIKVANTVRDVFPGHCRDFHRDDLYVFYTLLYVNVKNLRSGLTKEFLEHLYYNTISKTHYYDGIGGNGQIGIKETFRFPPDIYPQTYCEYFQLVLRENKRDTELADSIIVYSREIHLYNGDFNLYDCIKDIERLQFPVESFNETVKHIYLNISVYEKYSRQNLNNNSVIKYVTHYIRFIYNSIVLLERSEVGEKLVRTPEQFCAVNLDYYEQIPGKNPKKKGKGFLSCVFP